MKDAFIAKITLILCTLLPLAAAGQVKTETASSSIPSGSTRLIHAPVRALGTGDVVRDAFRNTLNAKSYRVQGVTSAKGESFKFVQEYLAQGRSRTVIESENDSSKRLEIIAIGKEAFIKANDGDWTKKNIDSDPFDLSEFQKQLDEWGKNDDDLADIIGPGKVGDTPVVGCQIASSSVTLKIWVGTNDHLIHKFEVELTSPQGGKENTTLTFYDYNADIKIEKPM